MINVALCLRPNHTNADMHDYECDIAHISITDVIINRIGKLISQSMSLPLFLLYALFALSTCIATPDYYWYNPTVLDVISCY